MSPGANFFTIACGILIFSIINFSIAPIINKNMLLIGLVVLEYSGENVISKPVDITEIELESHAISTLLELK